MADFVVSTEYKVEDRSSASMARIGGAADSLGGHLDKAKSAAVKFGAVLAGAFAINKAFGFAKSLVTMNAEMRQTKIGMAALLSTIGQNKRGETQLDRFRREMVNVGPIMDQLREMASHGIGTTADYRAAWQTLIMPLSRAGAGMKQVLNVSRLLIPVSKMLGIDSRIAAMQLQRMTMGQVRSFDRLPKMLGLSVQHVKALAKSNPAKLITEMEAALEKIGGPASILLGGEFGAQMDTFRDLWKGTKRKIGESLTEEVTKAVGGINDMWVANKPAIDAWAANVGKQLGEAFNTAFGYAKDAADFLQRHWDGIYRTGKALLELWLLIKAAQVAGAAWQMAAAGGGFAKGLLTKGVGGMLASAAAPVAAGGGGSALAGFLTTQLSAATLGPSAGLAALGTAAAATAGVLGALAGGYALGSIADEAFGLSDALAAAAGRIRGIYIPKELQLQTKQQEVASVQAQAWQHPYSLLRQYGANIPGGYAYDLTSEAHGGNTMQNKAFKEGLGITAVRGLVAAAKAYTGEGSGEKVGPQAKEMFLGSFQKGPAYKEEMLATLANAQAGMYPGVSIAEGTVKAIREKYGMDEALSENARTPNVNMDLRGSRFEVKVDARDRDPDDIATVFWDGVYRASEFKVRSSVSPAGSI